ncbi:VOC family protein [Ahrensia kielensis]|uniref:VOC family protein n=1 Tax=Ahrensia kielensis TaxID=76980 RepID=A0ABU9T3E8_9HYPH
MVFEPRLTMITLGVENIERSTTFYEKLGFKKSSASQDSVTFFITSGTVLGLFGKAALAEDAGVEDMPVQYRGVSISHNLDDEQAVDEAFAHALSCGATATKQPHKTFWGGYSGYFTDPDGHLWELAHNPFAPLDENRNMPLPE